MFLYKKKHKLMNTNARTLPGKSSAHNKKGKKMLVQNHFFNLALTVILLFFKIFYTIWERIKQFNSYHIKKRNI